MDPITVGLLGAAAIKAVPGVINGVSSFFNDKSGYDYDAARFAAGLQFQYQAALQQHQQAWEERMSNTAHQREMLDLQRAGLNPILTATGGNGAATPSMSAGQAGMPDAVSEKAAILQNKIAKQQNALNTLQTLSNVELQSKQALQAQTSAELQQKQSDLTSMKTLTETINMLLNKKDLDYYDKKFLLNAQESIAKTSNYYASNSLMRAQISNMEYLAPYQAEQYASQARLNDRLPVNTTSIKGPLGIGITTQNNYTTDIHNHGSEEPHWRAYPTYDSKGKIIHTKYKYE